MQQNLDQKKIYISIAPDQVQSKMASQAAKLCRVSIVFAIALMASDLLFAKQQITGRESYAVFARSFSLY